MDRRQRWMARMKRRRRAPDSSSSTFRQRAHPDGLDGVGVGGRVGVRTMVGRRRWGGSGGGGGGVGQRDTCGRQNLLHLSNKYRETLSLSHSQLCSVLFILAQPLAANVDGMFARLPLAPLRHDVTLTKCRILLFAAFFKKRRKKKEELQFQEDCKQWCKKRYKDGQKNKPKTWVINSAGVTAAVADQ